MKHPGEPDTWAYIVVVEVLLLAVSSGTFWPYPWWIMFPLLNFGIECVFALGILYVFIIAASWEDETDE